MLLMKLEDKAFCASRCYLKQEGLQCEGFALLLFFNY